jgi:hypothetical protein
MRTPHARVLAALATLVAACGPGTVTLDTADPPLDDTLDEEGGDTDDGADTDEADPDDGWGPGEVPPCQPVGMLVEGPVRVDTGASLTRRDADVPGVVLALRTTEACGLSVGSGDILGDVRIGVGGDPDAVVCLERSADLEGQVSALTEDLPLDRLTLPDDLPESRGSVTVEWNETLAIAGDAVVDDLVVDTGGQVTLDSGAYLVVRGDLRTEGGARVVAAGESSATLWVGGAVTVDWNSRVGEPEGTHLDIVVSGDGPVTLARGGALHGRLFAPEAEVRANGGRLSGALQVGSLEAAWNSRVQVDPRYVCD